MPTGSEPLIIERVVADSDLDGLIAASILKRAHPNAEVRFSHAAQVRSGSMDAYIDRTTALCDLPFHPACGVHFDHHRTNRAKGEERATFIAAGGIDAWADAPSAARVVYDWYATSLDLQDLAPHMPIIDALDGGGIRLQDFLDDGPLVCFARCLGSGSMNLLHLALDHLASGGVIEGLWEIPEVRAAMNHARSDRGEMEELIRERSSITDRLAVVRLDGQARRPSGYLVTAVLGAECDACCIIHGYVDGSIDDPDRPALGASFYANSFHAHQHDGFDLSTLATSLDVTGGGHANACGCRIQPVDGRGFIEDRTLEPSDVERNLAHWFHLWSQRSHR